MAQQDPTTTDQLTQLNNARTLVLGDSHYYEQIISGILPIIGPSAKLELRRWGADFLAEAFANPTWAVDTKEKLSGAVLGVLRSWLDIPDEDHAVVKAAIQTAASIYAFVFRAVISKSQESATWENMTAIKSNILKRMDTAPTGIRICCIKFVQKVVQVQTPGVITDPRRPEQNETSISLVPRNHLLLSLPNLEAEASGLLDRLLNVFHDNSSDAVLINSTLSCVAVLVRNRPAIANKIITVILNYNPLKQANSPMNPSLRVALKSMERTTRAVLKNINKTNPNGPLAGKIDAYMVRLQQSRNAVFADTTSLKRSAPAEPTDGLDNAKRAKLAGGPMYPPMPPPPNSFAQLFTLTDDAALGEFDVKVLPIDLVSQITSAILNYVDEEGLERAIGEVKSRYFHLQKQAQANAVRALAGASGAEDDDEYDPEYEPDAGDAEAAPVTAPIPDFLQPDIALGPFELPRPPPLSEEQLSTVAKQTVDRVLGMITLAEGSAGSRQKLGINRLAASNNDREAWVTMMTRLATRAPSGLNELVAESADENGDIDSVVKSEQVDAPSIANGVRQTLFGYILEDFRPRLNLATSWLNEEWYAETLAVRSNPKAISDNSDPKPSLPIYTYYSTLFFRTILPYLDARSPQDTRLLIRFLSEIPAISTNILKLVESLADDPERIGMCTRALQYLIMMRPPVREDALDVVESLWTSNEEARLEARKVLTRWRPEVLQEGGAPNGTIKKT